MRTSTTRQTRWVCKRAPTAPGRVGGVTSARARTDRGQLTRVYEETPRLDLARMHRRIGAHGRDRNEEDEDGNHQHTSRHSGFLVALLGGVLCVCRPAVSSNLHRCCLRPAACFASPVARVTAPTTVSREPERSHHRKHHDGVGGDRPRPAAKAAGQIGGRLCGRREGAPAPLSRRFAHEPPHHQHPTAKRGVVPLPPRHFEEREHIRCVGA